VDCQLYYRFLIRLFCRSDNSVIHTAGYSVIFLNFTKVLSQWKSAMTLVLLSSFRKSRQTINLSNNWLTVIRWGETISKITTLLHLGLCLFTIIYLWLRHWFASWYTQRMQFNLSNPYPIDGLAFLLTQVCLVCPWVLHNGQITVHVREHIPHSTNNTFISVWNKECNWIC